MWCTFHKYKSSPHGTLGLVLEHTNSRIHEQRPESSLIVIMFPKLTKEISNNNISLRHEKPVQGLSPCIGNIDSEWHVLQGKREVPQHIQYRRFAGTNSIGNN